jgi:peptidoglycan/LPS O-acetylase OafA/YrhL
MTQQLSDKLKIVSAFLIVIVVMMHTSFNYAEGSIDMRWNFKIQDFFLQILGRSAVPMFFVISGFLFFRNIENVKTVFSKIRKRIVTLLIPYLIACTLYVIFALLENLLPPSLHYMDVSALPLFDNNFLAISKAIYFANGANPVAFHLYFLRDLIILVALSPLIYLIFRYLRRWGVAVLFVLYYAGTLMGINVINEAFPLRISSVFWFVAGGSLGFFKVKFTIPRIWKWILLLAFLLQCAVQLLTIQKTLWQPINVLLIVWGMAAIWCAYDLIVSNKFLLGKCSWLSVAVSYTFFVYLYHVPLLNIIRQTTLLLCGKSAMGYLATYFLSAFTTIILVIIFGILLKKFVPRIYSVMAGGR